MVFWNVHEILHWNILHIRKNRKPGRNPVPYNLSVCIKCPDSFVSLTYFKKALLPRLDITDGTKKERMSTKNSIDSTLTNVPSVRFFLITWLGENPIYQYFITFIAFEMISLYSRVALFPKILFKIVILHNIKRLFPKNHKNYEFSKKLPIWILLICNFDTLVAWHNFRF